MKKQSMDDYGEMEPVGIKQGRKRSFNRDIEKEDRSRQVRRLPPREYRKIKIKGNQWEDWDN